MYFYSQPGKPRLPLSVLKIQYGLQSVYDLIIIIIIIIIIMITITMKREKKMIFDIANFQPKLLKSAL